MGVLSEQHPFEGSGIRPQFTVCCYSGGTIPRHECFCSVLCMWRITPFRTAPFTNCALGYLLLLLHSRSLLVKSAPTCLLFNHAITSDDHIFYLTFHFHQRRQKENKATHTLLNSAQKILHWTIYHLLRTITRMNKTIRQNKKQHSLLVDLRNLCSAGLCIL